MPAAVLWGEAGRVSSCCRRSPYLGGREIGDSKKRSSAAEGL
jgi:hypothetical protein